MPIPLEDNYTDVLGKAMRGLGLSAEALAGHAGVEASAVASLLGGTLELESTVGEGTTAVMTLPVSLAV